MGEPCRRMLADVSGAVKGSFVNPSLWDPGKDRAGPLHRGRDDTLQKGSWEVGVSTPLELQTQSQQGHF